MTAALLYKVVMEFILNSTVYSRYSFNLNLLYFLIDFHTGLIHNSPYTMHLEISARNGCAELGTGFYGMHGVDIIPQLY